MEGNGSEWKGIEGQTVNKLLRNTILQHHCNNTSNIIWFTCIPYLIFVFYYERAKRKKLKSK